MPTLRRLLAACGFDVTLALTRLPLPEDVAVQPQSQDDLRAAMAQALERR